MRRCAVILVAAALLSGCTATADQSAGESTAAESTAAELTRPASTTPSTSTPTTAPAEDRGVDVYVPSGYDAATPAPLVLLLHGYSSTGAQIEEYVGLRAIADQQGFLYAAPDGSPDAQGNQFWDATDACCNFSGTPVDDSAFLADAIDQISADYSVDAKRIYVVGHSNGGFMAYRMACEHAETVAAIVSIAGATFTDTAQCDPSEPVSVLQIHGDADQVISYTGGGFFAAYPAAAATVATWAGYDECGTSPLPGPAPLDLEATIAGAESTVSAFPACPSGVAVELWTIAGGTHIPALSASFASDVVDFLSDHPKP